MSCWRRCWRVAGHPNRKAPRRGQGCHHHRGACPPGTDRRPARPRGSGARCRDPAASQRHRAAPAVRARHRGARRPAAVPDQPGPLPGRCRHGRRRPAAGRGCAGARTGANDTAPAPGRGRCGQPAGLRRRGVAARPGRRRCGAGPRHASAATARPEVRHGGGPDPGSHRPGAGHRGSAGQQRRQQPDGTHPADRPGLRRRAPSGVLARGPAADAGDAEDGRRRRPAGGGAAQQRRAV